MTRSRITAARIAILAFAIAVGATVAPATASASPSPWCGVFHFDVRCWR